MSAPRCVSLVGLMGTGKTSVAHALAARWPGFVARDLDVLVEAEAGLSIRAIFDLHGEAGFRALEARALAAAVTAPEATILATGGGAPCQPGAMERLLAAGPVVWLDAPPAALVLRALTATRPLLANRSPSEAEAVLSALLTARAPTYARATHRVDASLPLEDVVTRIAQVLGPA